MFTYRVDRDFLPHEVYDGDYNTLFGHSKEPGVSLIGVIRGSSILLTLAVRCLVHITTLRRLSNFLQLKTKITLIRALILYPILDCANVCCTDLTIILLTTPLRYFKCLQNVCIRFIFDSPYRRFRVYRRSKALSFLFLVPSFLYL